MTVTYDTETLPDPQRPRHEELARGLAFAAKRAARERGKLLSQTAKAEQALATLRADAAELERFIDIVADLNPETGPQGVNDDLVLVLRYRLTPVERRFGGSHGTLSLIAFTEHVSASHGPELGAPTSRESWDALATRPCPCCGRAATVVGTLDDETALPEGDIRVTTLHTLCFSCSRACAFAECGVGPGYQFGTAADAWPK